MGDIRIFANIFNVCKFMQIMRIYANHSISNIFKLAAMRSIQIEIMYLNPIIVFIFAMRIYRIIKYIKYVTMLNIFTKNTLYYKTNPLKLKNYFCYEAKQNLFSWYNVLIIGGVQIFDLG